MRKRLVRRGTYRRIKRDKRLMGKTGRVLKKQKKEEKGKKKKKEKKKKKRKKKKKITWVGKPQKGAQNSESKK